MFHSCSWRDLFTYLLRVLKFPFSGRRFFLISPPFLSVCKVLDKRNWRVTSLYIESSSDYWTVSQVFHDEDYSIENLARYAEVQRMLECFLEAKLDGLILDLGANIGASARLFSINWVGSKVWCFEPSSRNFELLRRNAGEDTKVFQAAVGGKDGYCAIENPSANPDGFRISEQFLDDTVAKVELISMHSIMKSISASGCKPLIMKVDIEGAEREVFRDASKWLGEWPVVMVELHDWLLPCSASSANVLKAFADEGRDVIISGSTLVSFWNKKQ